MLKILLVIKCTQAFLLFGFLYILLLPFWRLHAPGRVVGAAASPSPSKAPPQVEVWRRWTRSSVPRTREPGCLGSTKGAQGLPGTIKVHRWSHGQKTTDVVGLYRGCIGSLLEGYQLCTRSFDHGSHGAHSWDSVSPSRPW